MGRWQFRNFPDVPEQSRLPVTEVAIVVLSGIDPDDAELVNRVGEHLCLSARIEEDYDVAVITVTFEDEADGTVRHTLERETAFLRDGTDLLTWKKVRARAAHGMVPTATLRLRFYSKAVAAHFKLAFAD